MIAPVLSRLFLATTAPKPLLAKEGSQLTNSPPPRRGGQGVVSAHGR